MARRRRLRRLGPELRGLEARGHARRVAARGAARRARPGHACLRRLAHPPRLGCQGRLRLGERAVFVSGATKGAERQEHYDEVAEATGKIIIATYGIAAVGINIPRIFNLVLIEPGKSFVRVIQSIGRGIRKAEDKEHVQIWDVTSTCKFAKRHLTKRKQFYKEANYPFTQEKLEWMKIK